jgi:hypothetical protein
MNYTFVYVLCYTSYRLHTWLKTSSCTNYSVITILKMTKTDPKVFFGFQEITIHFQIFYPQFKIFKPHFPFFVLFWQSVQAIRLTVGFANKAVAHGCLYISIRMTKSLGNLNKNCELLFSSKIRNIHLGAQISTFYLKII